jgi:hypothetical protein
MISHSLILITQLIHCLVFNASNPVQTVRNMTGIANKEMISAFVDKINMLVDGG